MLSDDKYFPEAYKVYMNLIWLSGGVGMGASDEAGSIDYKPTDTQMQVLRRDREGSGGREGRRSTSCCPATLPAFNKRWPARSRRLAERVARREPSARPEGLEFRRAV